MKTAHGDRAVLVKKPRTTRVPTKAVAKATRTPWGRLMHSWYSAALAPLVGLGIGCLMAIGLMRRIEHRAAVVMHWIQPERRSLFHH